MGRERAGFTSEVLPPYPKTTRSEWLSGTQMEWSSDVNPQQIDETSQSESLLHNGDVEIYWNAFIHLSCLVSLCIILKERPENKCNDSFISLSNFLIKKTIYDM